MATRNPSVAYTQNYTNYNRRDRYNTKSPMNMLNDEMYAMYDREKQSSESFDRKVQIFQVVRRYFMSNPEFRHQYNIQHVLPFGSSMTVLATDVSDLDICVVVPKRDDVKQDYDEIRKTFSSDLKRKLIFDDVTNVNHIAEARVPIVKFKVEGVEVDVSIYTGNRPPPSVIVVHFINAYAQYNRRFPVLAHFVKQWFKSVTTKHGSTFDVHSSVPNSYTLTLMVIHFLQQQNVLPNLYTEFKEKFDIDVVSWNEVEEWYRDDHRKAIPDANLLSWNKNKNRNSSLPVSVLLHRMANYYSKMDFVKEGIDVATGQQCIRDGRDSQVPYGLYIKDPYDHFGPGRRVKHAHVFKFFMIEASHRLSSMPTVANLWEMPIDTTLIDYNIIDLEKLYSHSGSRMRRHTVPTTTDNVQYGAPAQWQHTPRPPPVPVVPAPQQQQYTRVYAYEHFVNPYSCLFMPVLPVLPVFWIPPQNPRNRRRVLSDAFPNRGSRPGSRNEGAQGPSGHRRNA